MSELQVNTSPLELETIANDLVVIETQIQAYKALEKRYKEEKEKMVNVMQENNLKSLTLPNGTKFTLVAGTEDEWFPETKFDETRFKDEHADLYQEYLKDVMNWKAGRKAYVRITLSKEK